MIVASSATYTKWCQKFTGAKHCRIRSCIWYSLMFNNIMNLVIDVVLVLLKFVWFCQWILYALNINMAKHINFVITTTSLNYIILGSHTFYIARKTNPSYVCVSYTLRDIGIHFHTLLNKNEEVSWLYLIETFFATSIKLCLSFLSTLVSKFVLKGGMKFKRRRFPKLIHRSSQSNIIRPFAKFMHLYIHVTK